MLGYVTNFESVQVVFLLVVGLVIIFALAARRWRQSEELASEDARQKDLLPLQQQVGKKLAKTQDYE
jgi:hypothetical protein